MGPRDDISEENRRRHETERQLALQHPAPFIEGLPEGELARPYLSYGSQMFTLRRIFSEIQGDTEYGRSSSRCCPRIAWNSQSGRRSSNMTDTVLDLLLSKSGRRASPNSLSRSANTQS